MSTDNEFISNFQESTAENNVDLGSKFVSKSYLIDIYPYLDGLGNNLITAGLWTWGYNLYGQIGDNTTTNRSSPSQTISGGTNWTQVAGGINHTVAIKTDGTLWGWGLNGNGQLGDSTTTNKSSPVQTITYATNWKQVTGGHYHSSAIKTDGTLWSWGYNTYGALGDSTITHRSSPVQTITGGTNWKQVSGGYYHTVAIKTDGTLWCWGFGQYGQLGDSTLTTTRRSPTQTIAFGTNWKQVSSGSYHSSAIKTDGTLWSWGYNLYGALGDSTITHRSSPVQTITGDTSWKQVSCGDLFTAAIKTDGTLWLWGQNNYGQLGDSTKTNRSSPVQTITYGTNWKQVAGGFAITKAIKTDGTLWSCGYNLRGALGDSTLSHRSSPVQTIAGGTTWKQVSGGQYHTAAIKEMGDDF